MLDRARVREIFAEALDLPTSEVDVFLTRACGPDAVLRREVESLLMAAAGRPAFLGAPTSAPSGLLAAGRGEAAGTTMGHYRLLHEIGSGGFGSVYAAEQTAPVRRTVAVKIIKLGMDTRAVIARFEAERQALAMMDHANIARVFDAGATEAGRPYFVMELVKGEPITAYCDKNGLDIGKRLELFVQVCRAVQHAHSKGVIHRDIKPGNVLVATDDGRAHVKVIDFGIAKATQQSLTEKTVFTEARQFVGTPEYMSPEQADGSLSADTRADVYSLGVLLYELLTGATPFEGTSLRSAAYGEIQRIIREVEPVKPSTRVFMDGKTAESARTEQPGAARKSSLIRGDLDWIVMRCLEKERSRRYDTVDALASDVGRHLTGEPVMAAPPSRVYQARKFIRRHRLATAAGGLIMASLVLGVTGTTIGLVRARAARAEAVQSAGQAAANAEQAGKEAARADLQAEEARMSARVAEGVNQLMTSMIGRANRAKEQGRTDVTVREVMDAAAADLTAGVATQEPRVAMMLAKTLGETYEQLNLLEEAERAFRTFYTLAGEHLGVQSRPRASSALLLGDLVRKRGNYDEARRLFVEVRAITLALGDSAAELYASTFVNEANIDLRTGNAAKAEGDLRAVLALLEDKGLGQSQTAASATNNLATILYTLGKRDEALTQYERSLELHRVLHDEPDMLKLLVNIAVFQHAQRHLAEAGKSADEAVALARRLYGERHLAYAEALETQSMVRFSLEMSREAITGQREVIAVKRALLKPGHEAVITSVRKLGTFLLDAGEDVEAESALREACEGSVALWPVGDPDFVFARYQRAVALTRLDRRTEAEGLLRAALKDSESTLKAGTRLWWMRGACGCLLAGILAMEAESLRDSGAQAQRIEELQGLIDTYAEKLMTAMQATGEKMRRTVIGRSLDQVVAACETVARLQPSTEHAAAVAAWQARRGQFCAETGQAKPDGPGPR